MATQQAARPATTRTITLPHLPVAFRISLPTLSAGLAAGLFILMTIGVVALLAPQIAPYTVDGINAQNRLLSPSWSHLFGTDNYGRDLFSRIIVGSRVSLGVAVSAVLIGLIPGVLAGLMAGTYRGLWSALLTQAVDAWLALPGVLVALVMVAAFGRSLTVLVVALGISAFPMFYRLTRAETLRAASELYVEAAESLGASRPRILLQHILPNIASPIIVMVSLACGRMLLATSALSFIGLGVPPPTPEWGNLIAEGRDYMHTAWWLLWFPGLAIGITTLGFHLVGNSLIDRNCRDPR